jgi:hypothetical protein
MSCRNIRRTLAALMAVVLAVGLLTHGLGGPNVVIKSVMAVTNDMPMSGDMPGKCNGCAGDEKGVAPAVCAAFCGAALASLAVVVFAPIPADILTPPAERIAVGRADPPDPYPPRPVVLS